MELTVVWISVADAFVPWDVVLDQVARKVTDVIHVPSRDSPLPDPRSSALEIKIVPGNVESGVDISESHAVRICQLLCGGVELLCVGVALGQNEGCCDA